MKNLEPLTQYIQHLAPRLRTLSNAIWNHPELAFQEVFATEQVKQFLTEQGFAVTMPYCGLDTAFRAEYGCGSPAFGIFAEFDALPDVGHGCGHNLICAAGLAAFCAVADFLKTQDLPGKVVLFGSPAEEAGGGKVKMVNAGCLEGIDAAMMVHPFARTIPDMGSTAIYSYDVVFHGKAAHAAGAPEHGINALTAVNLLFMAVNAYREHVPEDSRMHGIITEGGEAPNVTPSRAACRFFLRSTNEEWMAKINQRFLDMVHGAELMTGAAAEIIPCHLPYKSRKPNAALNRLYLDGMAAQGVEWEQPARGGRGSSDFGNIARVVPGIHPYFAVAEEDVAAHSIPFRDASITDYAFENAMRAASSMANVALTYLMEPDFREEVAADFAK